MKRLLIILFFISIHIRLFGFYGNGSGRSFIDFLMDRYYFRARTDQIGFLYGTEHVRFAFGVTGNTTGVILDNWTNDSSTNNKLSSYFRPSVSVAVGYKSDLISVGAGYQFKYIDSNYMIHTPDLMLTAMDNTLVVSTAVEVRYYLHKVIDYLSQLRLYLNYGYARISYAKNLIDRGYTQLDENNKATYKDVSSINVDFRAYFNITAYGFDYTGMDFDDSGNEKLLGGYIASLPAIPNAQGLVIAEGIYRIGLALPLGLRASNDFVSLYVEPSLSATIIGGKITLMGSERKGFFYTFGYVVYADLTITPIKDLELYLELQTGGATRLGGYLYAASTTTMVLNSSCGVAWYF